jgi:hypothetical protein
MGGSNPPPRSCVAEQYGLQRPPESRVIPRRTGGLSPCIPTTSFVQFYAMSTKQRTYGRALRDPVVHNIIDEIEKYQGRVPYEMTPLTLESLHNYIVWLEDTVDLFRHRLIQFGAHHLAQMPEEVKKE